MNKKHIFVFAFLFSLLGLTRVAFAEPVDYDEIDAMALKMAAQSEQAQASDQFVRVYSQVLAFDENQYGTSFNQPTLEASMVAGGIAWAYDDGSATTDEVRISIESLGLFALDLYGYAAGTTKYNALRSIWQWLGKAWHCYWDCGKKYWTQVWKCIDGTTGSIVTFVGTVIGAIGAGLWAGGVVVIGKIIVIAGAVIVVGVAVICILLYVKEQYVCLYNCIAGP